MSIYSQRSTPKMISAIPPQVVDLIEHDDPDFEIQQGVDVIKGHDAVLFTPPEGGTYAIVPNHKHDLHESNVGEIGNHNAKQVFATSLLGGPTATVFAKVNESLPAYFVFKTYDDDYLYHYVVWH